MSSLEDMLRSQTQILEEFKSEMTSLSQAVNRQQVSIDYMSDVSV